jgi:Ca2+-binding RTX toxin-like protein
LVGSTVLADPGQALRSNIDVITGTKGDDEIFASEQMNTRVQAFSGDDLVDLTEAGVENNVDAGSGNDSVFDSPFYDKIVLRDGNDMVTHTGGNDYISGGDGDDVFVAYLEQALNPPALPYDPGKPYVTRIEGDDGIDNMTFHMTEEQITAGYVEAIAAAFENWDHEGELDLRVATQNLNQPLNIILLDIEVLTIVDQNGVIILVTS